MRILPAQNYYNNTFFHGQSKNNFLTVPLNIQGFDSVSFGRIAVYAKKIQGDEPPLRFKSVEEAGKYLGSETSRNIIYSVLNNESKSAYGYMFIKAKDVETENGKTDKKRMQAFLDTVKKFEISKVIYAKKIGSDEPPIRFSSIKEAAEILGLSPKCITSVLNGQNHTSQGYFFARARDIEDEKGETDEQKMKAFMRTVIRYENSKAIYAKKVEDEKPPEKFKNLKEASDALNISEFNIRSALAGERILTHGYIFTSAKNIENEDGETDEKKIKYFMDAVNKYKNSKAIYAKKPGSDEPPVRYNNTEEAANALDISYANIYAVLYGKSYSAGGYMFVRAEDVSTNGKTDEKKMDSFLNAVKRYEISKAVYAKKVGSEEPPLRFSNIKEASKKLNIPESTIRGIFNGNIYSAHNYIFTEAGNIENDKGEVDKDAMKDFLNYAASYKRAIHSRKKS